MYYLRIYFENSIKEVPIKPDKEYSFGCGNHDNILYKDFPKSMSPIKFSLSGDAWKVSYANKETDLHSIVGNSLSLNRVYVVSDLLEVAFAIYKLDASNEKTYKVNKSEIVVGSDRNSDICIRDRYVSKNHLKLLRYGDKWYFEDLVNENGTYVNGKRHSHLMLFDNDELCIGFSKIKISHNIVKISYSGEIIFNLPNLDREKIVNSIKDDYPYYYKPQTRLKEDVPTDEIEVEKAPSIGVKPKISWISVLVPPIMMGGIMTAVVIMTKASTASLLLTIPMFTVGIITSVLRYKSEVDSFASKGKQRTKVYEKYLDEQVSKIEKSANQQRKALNLDNPSTKYCMESVEALSTMWDRNIKDKDFMTLRIGSGSVKASFKITVPKKTLELEEDVYMTQIRQVADECRNVNNVPVTVDLHAHQSIGIIGNKLKRDALTKNLIYQAAFHHNYDNLKIILICDNDDKANYDFVKWLPHNYDDQKTMRYFANDKVSSTSILDKIADIIEERENIKLNDYDVAKPYYLIISTSRNLTLSHAISRKLTQLKPQVNIGTIFNYDNISDLPNDCYYICDMSNMPIVYEKDHSSIKTGFVLDQVDVLDYEKYSRKMSPIITDTENKGAGFPKNITFMQGMKATTFEKLGVDNNWKNPTPERSMAVPIGKTNTGEDFYFDIHEKSMGPHGLVAGMTGSGKSEAVQTFMLSLACKFPPDAVSFVIIDFKGTGLILPFKKMPHLAGTISDIDTNISRNLVALMTELERRKALLDEYKVSNISSYLKLYHEGNAKEPLSYLFIVIDEFAEFKKKFPDFMKAISSIFRIGRTLGVHIILLTQKPASVVDDEMKANTRFRWCLKVASSSDSSDMLHHPDAAKITNAGRAYIQVGEDEIYEQVQTYYSGAKYIEPSEKDISSCDIAIIDEYGNRKLYRGAETFADKSKESEIEYVVSNLQKLALENNYSFARKVWSEKLPDLVSVDEVEKTKFDGEKWKDSEQVTSYAPVIGLFDDPRKQVQLPLRFDFTEGGSYTLYGAPGMGKTTLLNTLIYSTAVNYTPDDVNMYILDFGGGSLNVYNKLPHVGGVVLPDESEKLIMLQKMLSTELNRRKKLFAKEGLTNITAYKKTFNDVKLPFILLMIDNYAYAVQNYPDLPDFLLTYIRDGGNYGMYFINTVSTMTSMSFRLAENVKNKISLYMTDKGDYNGIFGMNPGITIDSIKGHGITKYGKYCVEYQTALPLKSNDENERVKEVRSMIEAVYNAWKGNIAKAIPVLPEKFRYNDYPTNNIMLGISKDSVEPIEVDINDRPFILISNYRNNMFEDMLYRQVIEKHAPTKKMFYGDFSKFDEKSLTKSEDIENALNDIILELDKRKKEKASNSDTKFTNILIYIKLYNEFSSNVDQKVKDMLLDIVRLGKGLNVLVIISEASNRMSSDLNNDKLIIKMNDIGVCLLLGGTLSDNHSFARLNLSFSEKQAEILLNEAYIIKKNEIGESEFDYIRTCM